MRTLYRVWPAELSSAQTDRILGLARKQRGQEGSIFTLSNNTENIRSCTVRWIESSWLQSLLWEYVREANQGGFDVHVDRHAEMQMVEYIADREDHYGWHHDVQWNGSSGLDRKLSVTIQLSDPHEYVGGNFEFEELSTNADFRSKGTVLVFPSYLRHRIRPVTSGTRLSLVAWFFGPSWA